MSDSGRRDEVDFSPIITGLRDVIESAYAGN